MYNCVRRLWLALFVVICVGLADCSAGDADDPNWNGSLYEVLGVGPGANTELIRTSYRKLVRKWHPDKIKDPSKKQEAIDKTSLINKAYEILSDPKRRKVYDLSGSEQQADEVENDFIILSSTPSFGAANFTEQAQLPRDKEDVWLIQFYKDSSSTCRAFSSVWEKLAKSLKGNVRLARVNVKAEKRLVMQNFHPSLARDLPQVVALYPDGSWVAHEGSIRRLQIQKFVEQQLAKTVQFSQVDNLDAMQTWEQKSRDVAHAVFAGKGSKPSLAMLSAAFRARRSMSFAYISTKAASGKGLVKKLKMKGGDVAIRVSRESKIPPTIQTFSKPSRNDLVEFIMPNRFLVLPQLTGDNWSELCETGSVKRNCVIVFTQPKYVAEGRDEVVTKEGLKLTFRNDSHIVRNTLELAYGLAEQIPVRMELQFAWIDISRQEAFYKFFSEQYPDTTVHDEGCPKILLVNPFKKHFTWYAEKVKGKPAGALSQGIRRRHIKSWVLKFFDDDLKLTKVESLPVPESEGPPPRGWQENAIDMITESWYVLVLALVVVLIVGFQLSRSSGSTTGNDSWAADVVTNKKKKKGQKVKRS